MLNPKSEIRNPKQFPKFEFRICFDIRYSILVFYLALITFSTLQSNLYAETKLSIVCFSVEKDKPSVRLNIKGRYTIETLHKHQVLDKSTRSLAAVEVMPTNSGLKIGEREYPVYAIRIIPTLGVNISIDKRTFRGIVDIIRTKDMRLLVINHVDVEDYLYGVLHSEVPHYWPMETMMAQAITARTYALYRKKEMKNFDYDVTSDAYSQVYSGGAGEKWRSKRAVNLTKGKVLTYKGGIFPTYYHSTCGGYTENASNLWNIDLPPLKGRACPYCKISPRYRWKAIYSYKQIEERLNTDGIKCKNITYIVEGDRYKSGRLKTVRIRDAEGVKDIPANKFRLALDGSMIKSTYFTIEITPKGVIFNGKGWGHGVGMCQWGALGMAERGYDHKEILQFYYPGSEITKLGK